jgi:hypothetical protein
MLVLKMCRELGVRYDQCLSKMQVMSLVRFLFDFN